MYTEICHWPRLYMQVSTQCHGYSVKHIWSLQLVTCETLQPTKCCSISPAVSLCDWKSRKIAEKWQNDTSCHTKWL